MKEYDVIVIGVGAMGAAACWQLAKRGAKVLGIEQFDIGHALGSSHGHVRMTRTAYYEHPDYVPLILRANELWRKLERETSLDLLFQVGGMYFGPENGEVIAGSLRSALLHGLPHELLGRHQMRERCMPMRLPEDYVAFFEPAAGYLLVEKCVGAMVHAAMSNGAEIHGRERVLEWGDGWVRTELGEYRSRTIVFCGGAWTSQLAGDLGIPLEVTRQLVAWFAPDRRREVFGKHVWGIEEPEGLYYGFPMLAECPGFRVALHAKGPAIDPNATDRGDVSEDLAVLRSFLLRRIPKASGRVLSMKTCLYTNSPDHHFILGQHSHRRDVVLAAGFSGHGFKFATVMGEALAELAMEGKSQWPVGFLSPGRFEQSSS